MAQSHYRCRLSCFITYGKFLASRVVTISYKVPNPSKYPPVVQCRYNDALFCKKHPYSGNMHMLTVALAFWLNMHIIPAKLVYFGPKYWPEPLFEHVGRPHVFTRRYIQLNAGCDTDDAQRSKLPGYLLFLCNFRYPTGNKRPPGD